MYTYTCEKGTNKDSSFRIRCDTSLYTYTCTYRYIPVHVIQKLEDGKYYFLRSDAIFNEGFPVRGDSLPPKNRPSKYSYLILKPNIFQTSSSYPAGNQKNFKLLQGGHFFSEFIFTSKKKYNRINCRRDFSSRLYIARGFEEDIQNGRFFP